MDIKTAEKRSANMAAIKAKDTGPEIFLCKLMFRNGYRYRKNKKGLPGKPDLWLAKYNTAVFVNGCFWHRHKNCKYAYTPKSRIDFWNNKFSKNVERDLAVKEELEKMNIKNLIIWECTIRKALKSADAEQEMLKNIELFLNSDCLYREL